MAHRDQFVRPLRRHDPRDLRDREHIALLHPALQDDPQRLRLHLHRPAGNGDPFGVGLRPDIHHARPATRVEMRQSLLIHGAIVHSGIVLVRSAAEA